MVGVWRSERADVYLAVTHITLQTPPTFLLQDEDDHVDRVEDSLSYYAALKKVGVPVEMHLYAQRRACLWAAAHEVPSDAVA